MNQGRGEARENSRVRKALPIFSKQLGLGLLILLWRKRKIRWLAHGHDTSVQSQSSCLFFAPCSFLPTHVHPLHLLGKYCSFYRWNFDFKITYRIIKVTKLWLLEFLYQAFPFPSPPGDKITGTFQVRNRQYMEISYIISHSLIFHCYILALCEISSVAQTFITKAKQKSS